MIWAKTKETNNNKIVNKCKMPNELLCAFWRIVLKWKVVAC